MTESEDILAEIIAAWRANTGWEQFGHDVGAILTAHGITPGTRPMPRPTEQEHA